MTNDLHDRGTDRLLADIAATPDAVVAREMLADAAAKTLIEAAALAGSGAAVAHAARHDYSCAETAALRDGVAAGVRDDAWFLDAARDALRRLAHQAATLHRWQP